MGEQKTPVIRTMEIIELVKAGNYKQLKEKDVLVPERGLVRNNANQLKLALSAMEALVSDESEYSEALKDFAKIVSQYKGGRGRDKLHVYPGHEKTMKINSSRGSLHITHVGEYLGYGSAPYEDKNVQVVYGLDDDGETHQITIKAT